MKKLARKQISEQLKPFRNAALQHQPKRGWVRRIREALGMSSTQLAQRMNVSQPRINELETAELKDAVTLRALRNAAHAMNCELVYAIVPKEGALEDIYLEQAKKIARKRTEELQHTMTLEKQALSKKALEEQYQDILDDLLHGSPRHIWEE